MPFIELWIHIQTQYFSFFQNFYNITDDNDDDDEQQYRLVLHTIVTITQTMKGLQTKTNHKKIVHRVVQYQTIQ